RMPYAPTAPSSTTDGQLDRTRLADWYRRNRARSQALFDLERTHVFLNHWQVACHVNDVPHAGDWRAFDLLGERAVVVRGHDGVVRAFHNLCRHRGARVVDGVAGSCKGALVCPFHGWVYNLDGTLRGPARPKSFGNLDRSRYGLKPIECEIWLGFIFVRFAPGLPSVKEMMSPYAEELEAFELEKLIPNGRVTLRPRPVNWKNVGDNYSDGLHIPVAHPGLSRVFGKSYAIEARDWVDKMSGELVEQPSPRASERMYQKLITEMGLAEGATWAYYKLWPNAAIEVYPDQIDFMQFIPVSPTETLLREAPYALPDDRRTVVTSHDAFGYFGKAYGLKIIAPQGVSTESEASAQDVAKIIRQIKAQKIPAVFIENVTDHRLARPDRASRLILRPAFRPGRASGRSWS
ncbi:MAG: zinc ABC transporter solute-binding protein, partial [Nitrospira sp.]|nr:zinc ABC transporter solute-binding protein [Nitrospira sp.]